MKLRRIVFFLLLIFLCFYPGCRGNSMRVENPDSEMKILEETDTSVRFLEAGGGIVDLPKNPERTIVCLNSLLDIWYMAGGSALARLKGNINVPDEAMALPQLGTISTLNKELMMELEPDFVIVSCSEYQRSVRDFFAGEGVPGVSLDYSVYDDFRVILDLFVRLTGKQNLYREMVASIETQVQGIINQVPAEGPPPSVCILFASTTYVKVETPNTIAGYFCEKLGADNIYKDTALSGATRVELSLEYIWEQDPDIIFVTTMGDVEMCKARVEMDVAASDLWSHLSAVKANRFIYLDKSYSIYKPNRFYPEAFRIMAQYLYPDTIFTPGK